MIGRRSCPKAAIIPIAFIAVIGCSSVRIQTGSPTEEEATRNAVVRGKGVRSEWADRLREAPPQTKAVMVKTFIDSVTARYIEYGSRIAEQWRQGSEGRGEEIADSEMRQLVESWTASEKPLLESYDDVVDYGIEQLRETYFFDNITEQLFLDFRDHYFGVYSYVFYPNGDRRDYEFGLEGLRLKTENLSRQLTEDLRRYQ